MPDLVEILMDQLDYTRAAAGRVVALLTASEQDVIERESRQESGGIVAMAAVIYAARMRATDAMEDKTARSAARKAAGLDANRHAALIAKRVRVRVCDPLPPRDLHVNRRAPGIVIPDDAA